MERNANFPFERDFRVGNRYVSSILNNLGTSIDVQLNLRNQFIMFCHVYYRRYLPVNFGMFLNNHDLSNLVRLFNAVHPLASHHFTREGIFYFYCRVVADSGFVITSPLAEDVVVNLMSAEGLQASQDLPENHPHHQHASF